MMYTYIYVVYIYYKPLIVAYFWLIFFSYFLLSRSYALYLVVNKYLEVYMFRL